MNDETRVNELVRHWQELHTRGEKLSPVELCHDHPELLNKVLVKINEILSMVDVMATPPRMTTQSESTTPPPPADSASTTALSARPELPAHKILRELGRGGMGVVYHGWDSALNRDVAIKMILAGEYAAPDQLQRFISEAQNVAKFKHPNIVQIYSNGEHNQLPYFVMEYVDGGTLAQKIRDAPFAAKHAAQLMEIVARTIHAAHEQGLVHLDLKPANILLASDGTPKIADFGMAKEFGDESQSRTHIAGTPSYMSPEQARGRAKEIGPTSDVYALGAILYEMLTGRPPFLGESVMVTLEYVRTQNPVAPRQLQQNVPNDLDTICLKCLEKDAKNRYASAADLADDLQRFASGEPIRARPVGSLERFWRWCLHAQRSQEVGVATCFVSVVLTALYLCLLVWALQNITDPTWETFLYPSLLVCAGFIPLFFVGLGIRRRERRAFVAGAILSFLGICISASQLFFFPYDWGGPMIGFAAVVNFTLLGMLSLVGLMVYAVGLYRLWRDSDADNP